MYLKEQIMYLKVQIMYLNVQTYNLPYFISRATALTVELESEDSL